MPKLTVGFAHSAFRFADELTSRATGHVCWQVENLAALEQRIADADVLVTARVWNDALLAVAPRLRFIQASSAGTEQFAREPLRERGIRLASAQGVNTHAVAEHALGLLLCMSRRLNYAQRNQARHTWVAASPRLQDREDELHGKHMLVVGFGTIGQRIGALAQALGMTVSGIRRHAGAAVQGAEVIGTEGLDRALPRADVVVLACPLTPQTRGLIDAERLARMKPGACLINVGRGPVVDEGALIAALAEGRLAGAGLDCFENEPLPAESPLWDMENVVLTPHVAGNTRMYERRVVDLLLENLDRLAGGQALKNQVL